MLRICFALLPDSDQKYLEICTYLQSNKKYMSTVTAERGKKIAFPLVQMAVADGVFCIVYIALKRVFSLGYMNTGAVVVNSTKQYPLPNAVSRQNFIVSHHI